MGRAATVLALGLVILTGKMGQAQEVLSLPESNDPAASYPIPPAEPVHGGQVFMGPGHPGMVGEMSCCEMKTGRHHGYFKHLAAWLTHIPLHRPDKGCCVPKPLLHISDLYPFFLDRCGYGCGRGCGTYPGPVYPADGIVVAPK